MSQSQPSSAANETEDPPTEGKAGAELAPVAPARVPAGVNVDEVKEAITARGRERGFVTSEEILEGFPVEGPLLPSSSMRC